MSKTILITGATRGLGLELARQLFKSGHQVIMTGRDEERLKKEAQKISPEVFYYKMDVTIEEDVKRCAQFVAEKFKSLDVVVNNAGSIFEPFEFGSQDENPLNLSFDEFKKTMELNLYGPFLISKYFIPLLNKNKNRSDIINVSSGMGALTDMGTGVGAYRISKTALNSLSVFLAASFKGKNIYVNSVCPGWCKTDLGGEGATRSVSDGVIGMMWIINESPELSGKFIRDKEIIPY